MQVRDLGLMAEAVYEDKPFVSGYPLIDRQGAGGALNGFQAAAFYGGGNRFCIAFRGTAQAIDVVADARLGLGMNTTYFSQAEAFVSMFSGVKGRQIVLSGHSLGGAIAQIVANRSGYPMVTFNAPGVAVFASRNVWQANPLMLGVRAQGMALSALQDPKQAISDVRATFNRVRGLNICLDYDIVSRSGVHYGNVRRIPGTSMNPVTEHLIKTMNQVLNETSAASTASLNVFQL